MGPTLLHVSTLVELVLLSLISRTMVQVVWSSLVMSVHSINMYVTTVNQQTFIRDVKNSMLTLTLLHVARPMAGAKLMKMKHSLKEDKPCTSYFTCSTYFYLCLYFKRSRCANNRTTLEHNSKKQ